MVDWGIFVLAQLGVAVAIAVFYFITWGPGVTFFLRDWMRVMIPKEEYRSFAKAVGAILILATMLIDGWIIARVLSVVRGSR